MLGAIFQIPNLWLYAIVCPLKFRPLVCNVTACNASTKTVPTSVKAELETGAFHLKVSTRVFLRASAISMFIVGAICYYTNKWVLGDDKIASFGFRDHFVFMVETDTGDEQFRPGAAFAAVGS